MTGITKIASGISTVVVTDFDPGTVTPRGGHYVNGKWLTGPNEIAVRRPSDGQVYAELPDGGGEIVDQAVRTAHEAQRTSGWGSCAPRDRARVLRRWADLIDADAQYLGRLEAVGSTRPIREVLVDDVPFTAEGIRFFAELADKHGGDVISTQSDLMGLLIAEPIGVIGAIAPWNYPLDMASWKCAPALAAGNAIVLKPSELTPYSTLRLAELAVEAGIPPGIFNVVNGYGKTTGDAITRHPLVGKVSFTGSTHTGAAIMSNCAMSGNKPVTLELGGKSPQLVFDDATDLGKVARAVAAGIFSNAGQNCVAGSRLLVQRRIAGELLERIAEQAQELKPGPTWSADTKLPPIISTAQINRISGMVDGALADGAELLTGGRRFESLNPGTFYEPTVLTNVDAGMEVVRDEVFGPVLTVQVFDDDEEGLAMANDTRFGLAAGIYSGNINRALNAVRRLEAGTVWVNRYGRTWDFIIPTGGYKQSGIGKDLGWQAFKSHLRYKSVLMAID